MRQKLHLSLLVLHFSLHPFDDTLPASSHAAIRSRLHASALVAAQFDDAIRSRAPDPAAIQLAHADLPGHWLMVYTCSDASAISACGRGCTTMVQFCTSAAGHWCTWVTQRAISCSPSDISILTFNWNAGAAVELVAPPVISTASATAPAAKSAKAGTSSAAVL